MNSWKTNLLNLNSSISNELRTKVNNPTNIQAGGKESKVNKAAALAFDRGTNALGAAKAAIWNTLNQNNKLSNKDNKNSLLLLQNNKYENVKSYLSNINHNNMAEKGEAATALNFQYLNNCLSKTKLSLINYSFAEKKKGSIIKYNKIIGYNFANLYKTNVTGMALAPTESSNSNYYANTVNNAIIKNTYKLLFLFFKSMYCLISKPIIKYTNDKVTIQLFYYLNIPKKKIFRLFSILYLNSIKNKWLLNKNNKKSIYNLNSRTRRLSSDPRVSRSKSSSLFIRWKVRKAISRFKNKNNKNILFNLRKFDLTKVFGFSNKFKLICEILSNMFNKPVELQLTRLHHPYHDSNILVNLLALNIKNKRKKANWAIKKVYSKNQIKDLNDPALTQIKNIPAFLSGLNIKIAGRLMREPIIPRITTKLFEKGASATGKVNYLDVASITRKNRKGAYTIKVTSGQNFF
jgi:hypothetical protein